MLAEASGASARAPNKRLRPTALRAAADPQDVGPAKLATRMALMGRAIGALSYVERLPEVDVDTMCGLDDAALAMVESRHGK